MNRTKLLMIFSVILVFIACKSISADTGIKDTGEFFNIEWKMQEMRFLQQNQPYHYKRGGLTNDINFDNDFIEFKASGTGFYHQSDNTVYSLTWHFDDTHKTLLTFTIDSFRENQPLVVHWEHVRLANSKLTYTEYYTAVTGVQSLGAGIRVPK